MTRGASAHIDAQAFRSRWMLEPREYIGVWLPCQRGSEGGVV